MTPGLNTSCEKFHTRIFCKQSSQHGRTIVTGEWSKAREVKPALEVVETAPDSSQNLQWQLWHIERKSRLIGENLELMVPGTDLDIWLLQHLDGQVNHLETDLATITQDILYLEDENLSEEELWIGKGLSKFGLQIEQFLRDHTSNSQSSSTTGIQLPKVSVLSLDGNILNWGSFWEQFEITIHSKELIKDTEKLAYLKDALRMVQPRTPLKDSDKLQKITWRLLDTLRNVMPGLTWSTFIKRQ